MSAPSSSPETICLQCGDRGFDNAFVYCVKCLEVAVHRYCLDVIPKTTDEFVRWICDDCDVEFQNPPAVGKHDSGQCHSVDRTSDRIIGQSEVGTTDVVFQNPPAVAKHDSGQCHSVDRTSEHIIGQSEVGTTENDSVAVNTDTLPMELDILYSASERKQCENNATNIDDIISDCAKFVSDEDVKSEVSEERTSVSHNTSNLCNESFPKDLDVTLSEPVITPVWRGSFDIRNRNGDILDELVAHMSSRACHKVYEEACLFQTVLHLEILPKTDVWPKSFETSESVENNIALYFFPSDIRSERVYEHLVDEMVHEVLAMRVIVQNAELLIFASTELPTLYWRFQGKYYLWGVFRAKQNRAPSSQSYKGESRYNPVTHADLPKDTGFSWDMMTTRNPLTILLDQNRLNGTNYGDWKRNLNIVLTSEELTHVLNEEPPQMPVECASQEVKDAYKSWFDHDSLAKCFILASVEDRFHKQHYSLSTSKDVMASLKEMVIEENFPAIQTAMTALTCKMAQGTRVYEHVKKMIGYINELETLGAEMEREIKMDAVLFSLPKAFNQFVLNVSGRNSVMSLFGVRNILQRAKDWIEKDELPVVVGPEVVVKAATKSKPNKKRKRKSWTKENPKQCGLKKQVKDKSEDCCFHCGKVGHWRRNCREYLARVRNN